MKQIYKILFIFTLFFIGCDEQKIDSTILSKGSQMSQEAIDLAKNFDKESYKDLADLFLDTSKIDFSKEVFIIFGKNQCKYCDMLKDEIKKNPALQDTLKTHFNPYYINISYNKTHNFIPQKDSNADSAKNAESTQDSTKQISTENLAHIFGVSSTPMIAFLDKNMSIKYIYPGFSLQIQEMLNSVISSNKAMGDYKSIDKQIAAIKGSK